MATHILEFEKPIVELELKIDEMKALSSSNDNTFQKEIEKMYQKLDGLKAKIYGNLTPWQRVQLSRHPDRPYTLDYIKYMCDDFIEIHGDRHYADDCSIVCGPATIGGVKVMLIGQEKGRGTKEKIKRNFGSPNPEGYRKALRAMKLAEKFNLPIVSLVDTMGAFPGIEAEERGQGEAIAVNLREMSVLRVPIVVAIIGEGASGGALGIGVGDKILMLENAWYSVISPEGCAAILFNDNAKAPETAESLKLDADSLLELGVIDEKIMEPVGGANKDHKWQAETLKKHILENLEKLKGKDANTLIAERIEKYSQMGVYSV